MKSWIESQSCKFNFGLICIQVLPHYERIQFESYQQLTWILPSSVNLHIAQIMKEHTKFNFREFVSMFSHKKSMITYSNYKQPLLPSLWLGATWVLWEQGPIEMLIKIEVKQQ